MKRIVALILAVLMIGAVLAACGEGDQKDADRTVKTVISQKYDDGAAEKYADKVSKDDAGNTTYEFTGKKYEEYVEDHAKIVSSEISTKVAEEQGVDFGQYSLIKPEEGTVLIGVNAGKYDAAKAEAAADIYAQSAFKVFQGLEKPLSTIKVVYCNANNQREIYGSFEVTAK